VFERKIRDGVETVIRVETKRAEQRIERKFLAEPGISDDEMMSLLRRVNKEFELEVSELRGQVESLSRERAVMAKRVTAPTGLRVCYKQHGTDRIDWGVAVAVEKHGKDVLLRFDDGGWNPAESCFFTEAQCRRYHKMPPKDWNAKQAKIADGLERMAESIRRGLISPATGG